MCGRFALSAPEKAVRKHFDLKESAPLAPRYNIAPGQEIAAVRQRQSSNELVLFHWGLIPFWAKDARIGSRMINARAETISEKPSFRNSFEKYRCLIPANGFYEWKEISGKKRKQPCFIRMRDKGLFAMAALWSTWQDKTTGRTIQSCAIVTIEPNTLLQDIHNRMPVIISPEQYTLWLDPSAKPEDLKDLCRPFASEDMEAYPVSGLCNNSNIDTPECILEEKMEWSE